MLVMMKHPLHGRLPVYSVFEVEANKAAGWIVDEEAPELKAARPQAPAETLKPAPAPESPKSALKSFLAGFSEDEV